MKLLKLTYKTFVLVFLSVLFGCTEPFQFEDPVFESALVIEATITDEDKIQSVHISRSFPLDTVAAKGERGALVEITDETGRVFGFDDNGNGTYSSRMAFAAQNGRSYQLSVRTSYGKSYQSETVSIRASSTIDEIYAVREFKDDLEEGVFIYVDSYDASNNSLYYRYEYEETYKIIAPFYSGFEAFVFSPLPSTSVGFRASDSVGQVCYATDNSRRIIQTTTTNLGEDRVSRFAVRFINRENYIISHRYSILVKQYVQSREAFSYYKTLATLSGSESLFSQIQTGFLDGNISSQQDSSEKIIGFFEVASVTEKRLFFDYEDLFPGEALPDYIINCQFLSPPLIGLSGQTFPLYDAVYFGFVDFYDEYDTERNPLNFGQYGPYLMTPAGCGDCTKFGSRTVPSFWTE
ncbi:DUF4249 domain-containing protein [Maribacter aestuarii]|uniref:DUF4249 domain-containing protein n=1 Tax=Maribacter aestuarii TaxID=1130723 RepID=UPI0025A64EB8|nr:DUF4249 domain-containing protein [Maribacter aestuarii]